MSIIDFTDDARVCKCAECGHKFVDFKDAIAYYSEKTEKWYCEQCIRQNLDIIEWENDETWPGCAECKDKSGDYLYLVDDVPYCSACVFEHLPSIDFDALENEETEQDTFDVYRAWEERDY